MKLFALHEGTSPKTKINRRLISTPLDARDNFIRQRPIARVNAALILAEVDTPMTATAVDIYIIYVYIYIHTYARNVSLPLSRNNGRYAFHVCVHTRAQRWIGVHPLTHARSIVVDRG